MQQRSEQCYFLFKKKGLDNIAALFLFMSRRKTSLLERFYFVNKLLTNIHKFSLEPDFIYTIFNKVIDKSRNYIT